MLVGTKEVPLSFLFLCSASSFALASYCTSLALPLTMQYGTPIFRHRAGKNTTSYKWNKLIQLCIDIHRHILRSDKTTQTKAETSENSYRFAPVSGCCSGLKSSYFLSSVWIQLKKFKTSLQTTTTRFITMSTSCRKTHLNGIHIVSNNDQLCLLALH